MSHNAAPEPECKNGVLPAPLVPRDCVLRDFLPDMPIDPERFLSDTDWMLLTNEVRSARVALMAMAWRNNPTGSIPSATKRLWAITLSTPSRWKKIEKDAVAEFVLCSDGRLYHPWLCERARFAWDHLKAIRARSNNPRLNIRSHEWRTLRLSIFQRDNFTCSYCGERGGKLECDHVVPVAAGGSNDPSNLVTACFGCNRSKGAKSLDAWKLN